MTNDSIYALRRRLQCGDGTDLMDLVTYAWLASVMWVPVVAAWMLA